MNLYYYSFHLVIIAEYFSADALNCALSERPLFAWQVLESEGIAHKNGYIDRNYTMEKAEQLKSISDQTNPANNRILFRDYLYALYVISMDQMQFHKLEMNRFVGKNVSSKWVLFHATTLAIDCIFSKCIRLIK